MSNLQRVIFTPTRNGSEVGGLPDIVQGASGSITIDAIGMDTTPVTLSGATTGHYWRKNSPDSVYSIDGTITTNTNDFTWAVSATDTAVYSTVADPWYVVFKNNGLVSMPLEWIVKEDAGESNTPAAVQVATTLPITIELQGTDLIIYATQTTRSDITILPSNSDYTISTGGALINAGVGVTKVSSTSATVDQADFGKIFVILGTTDSTLTYNWNNTTTSPSSGVFTSTGAGTTSTSVVTYLNTLGSPQKKNTAEGWVYTGFNPTTVSQSNIVKTALGWIDI